MPSSALSQSASATAAEEGDEVKYGSKLQLLHVASGKFLTIDASSAALSEGQCMGVHAESAGSFHSAQFTMLSKLKSRGDGTAVRMGSSVVFWHAAHKVSLHKSKLLPKPYPSSTLDWNSYPADSCATSNAMFRP